MAFTFAGRYVESLLSKGVANRASVLPTTPVIVRLSDGVTLASLYTGRTKAAAASNPAVTDSNGNLDVWADPGDYLGYAVVGGVEQAAFPIRVEIDPTEADAFGTAVDVSFTPAGGVAATNVQTAIVELDTEKQTAAQVTAAVVVHESDASAAHAASAVAFTPAGTIAATDVQAAVVEVASDAASATALMVPLAQKGAASGVATLDGSSKIPTAQLPSLALSEFLGTSASQAAMLALVGQRGDYTVRTDTAPNSTWILTTDDPTLLANWLQISTVTDAVASVNGRTGAVTGLAEAADSVLKSLVDAAGDLIVGTAADTVGRLAKGAALDVLRVNAAGTALEYAAPSGTSVSDTAYDATSWNGVTDVAPSKNAVRDKIETLTAGGGLTPTAKTTTYTAVAGDLVLADATSGGFTVTSPAHAAGRIFSVKKVDASVNLVTVSAAAGTIDGAATVVIGEQYASRDFISDGTSWWLV